jgi:5-methylcytosine-specific restriction endonuclease McrA
VCRSYNKGKVDIDYLIQQTVKLGFNNVIDAFHNVNNNPLPQRFFIDERKGKTKGIILTDELLSLITVENLESEIEARWRLVEKAWKLNISSNLLTVNYDADQQILYTVSTSRRIDLTSVRSAISGYQKGKCFYCFAPISIISGSPHLADIDHFFPHKLGNLISPIDGVWNLVLACQSCNRGVGGKFDQLPTQPLLERLHTRNEFYINSHHPLRETLINQTGKNTTNRIRFLNSNYTIAKSTELINSSWSPTESYPAVF